MMARMEGDARGRAWASPGSAAEPQPPATGPAPAPVAAAGSRRAGGTVPQVAFRPMTVADVLDGGFAVVKARPRRILTLTAAFVVPVEVLAAWFGRNLGVTSTGLDETWFSTDPAVTGEASGLDVWGLVALTIVPSIALVCIAAALAHLVAGWSVGHDASGREMLRVVGRRWWPLLGSFVVVHLAELAGVFACYVGIVAVMTLFLVVAPVVGAEGASAGEALGRSIRLTRTRFWPVMGLALLMGVVSTVLGLSLSALPESIALNLGVGSAWPLVALGGIIAQMVTTPFVAAATVLTYFDLRVRTEGMDIELAARRALDPVA